MRMSGESTGPGDVAMTGWIVGIVALHKNPAVALKDFAEGEEIGGDVLLAFGETLLGSRELVHEGKAEIMLLAGEVDGGKDGWIGLGSLPTDLASQAGFVAGSLNVANHPEE